MSDKPLVSCLCVTRKKVPFLERAIQCFRDQTYPNKHLLVVFEDDDLETAELVSRLTDPRIETLAVPVSPKKSLGVLRNLAVESCRGEFFCQWDDDDWYHNERIAFQMYVIEESKRPACALMHWLMFDEKRGRAYVSSRRFWEGSLLCRKDLLRGDLQYANAAIGEDTELMTELVKRSLVFPVFMPKLYVYVYHGGNTFGAEHWRKTFKYGKELSRGASRTLADILEGKYSGAEASRWLDQLSE